MKRFLFVTLLISALMAVMHADAFADGSEFQKRELIRRYIILDQTDWKKLTKVNRHLIDDDMLDMVKAYMYDIVKNKIRRDKKGDEIPAEIFLYANLADYISALLNKKEENRLYLARMYEEFGYLDKSADICNNILMSDPKNVAVMEYLASLFERMSMQSEAYFTYRRILDLDRNNKVALYRYGVLNVALGKYRVAIDNFKKLLKLDPDNAVVRKFVDMYEGKIKGDRPNLQVEEKAVQHFLMAEKLFARGKYEESANEYANAIEIDPSFAKAYTYLGVSLMKQKKYDASVGVLESAVKVNPKDPEGYYFLGLVYEMQSTYENDTNLLKRARENYEKALQIDPGYRLAKEALNRMMNNGFPPYKQ